MSHSWPLVHAGLSRGLGFYLQHFGNLSKSYGALGAATALLLWFYVSSAAILISAEMNAELLGAAHDQLPVKEVPTPKDTAEPPIQSPG